MDVGLDFAVLVLPLTVVWGLKVGRKTKAGLVVIFGLGFAVCITGLVRVVLVVVETERKEFTGTFCTLLSYHTHSSVSFFPSSRSCLKFRQDA